jgi:tetratricopeptide (TPR) repeat protein
MLRSIEKTRRFFDPLRWKGFIWFGLLALLTTSIGCSNSARRGGGTQSGRAGLQRRTDRGKALLETAIIQLRDLPQDVDTDLRPPQVILDSRTSIDHQDVMAKLGPYPNQGEGPPVFNFLQVPKANSRFRGLGVQTGDIVKYYIDVDDSALATQDKHFGTRRQNTSSAEEAAEQETPWSEGFVRKASIDIPVAQVIDDNTLIVARPLVIPINVPEKIEIWRYGDQRMREFGQRLGRYHSRGKPALAWEPTPDERVLSQILDRLNPWSRQNQVLDDWEVEPLLETLPAELRNEVQLQPYISTEALARPSFELQGVRLLQQAIWLRDISEWARGDGFDNLRRATALFDWTVRNIQLVPDKDYRPRWPRQTLLYGDGTAAQRAWIFALLCRQQGLEVVVLSVADDNGQQKFWLPALLLDGKLYLFDTRLGLPIPGPDGESVATLRQVRADPALLTALDIGDLKYPVLADALKHVTADLVASPFELSRRARLLEAELSGEDRLVLTADPSLQTEAIQAGGEIANVRLWQLPFSTLRDQLRLKKHARKLEAVTFQPFAWRPNLYKARLLHFQGKKEVKKDPRRKGIDEVIDSHRDAVRLYIDPRVRPPQRILNQQNSPDKIAIYNRAKQNASYWLGLLSYDDGRYDTAADWLARRTLEDYPDGPWTNGARYNLARSYEAMGRFEDAIELLKQDDSAGRHGSLLRVRQLVRNAEAAQTKTERESHATENSATSVKKSSDEGQP